MSINNPLIIGIAGGSASGKTAISNNIASIIADEAILTIIRQDDYYKDQSHLVMEERVKTNYDHPQSFDTERLVEDLFALKRGETIEKPVYDFAQHTRSDKTEIIHPANIIILEGILILADPALRKLLDIKVFVQTPADIRFIRRLKRDVQERGRTLDSVINQYLSVVRVMHQEFIEPSKEFADIIVPMGGDNRVAIDLLITKILHTFQEKQEKSDKRK